MSRITSSLPIYRFKTTGNYPIKEMIDIVMDSRRWANYKCGNSFPIVDNTGTFDLLYSEFLNIASKELGPLELDPRNNRTCWGYVINKNFYLNGIHHHLKSSTINAVYYLSVPETEERREGSISFYNDSYKEIFNIKPCVGELIMFPNYLLHQPLQSYTDEYRISVNMEIICKDIWL